MKSNEVVGAASATYRKVVKKIATTLRTPANHSQYPSEDFKAIVGLIDSRSQERALDWYRRGIKRGFIEACDAILDEQLELKKGTLYCPSRIEISVRVRFRGDDWQDKSFRFSAKELEFKD